MVTLSAASSSVHAMIMIEVSTPLKMRDHAEPPGASVFVSNMNNLEPTIPDINRTAARQVSMLPSTASCRSKTTERQLVRGTLAPFTTTCVSSAATPSSCRSAEHDTHPLSPRPLLHQRSPARLSAPVCC
jgi:hypothetical protein